MYTSLIIFVHFLVSRLLSKVSYDKGIQPHTPSPISSSATRRGPTQYQEEAQKTKDSISHKTKDGAQHQKEAEGTKARRSRLTDNASQCQLEAGKNKPWRRIQTEEARQNVVKRIKAGECSLAKSKGTKETPQVPPGFLDTTEARLESPPRLAIAGTEPLDLGEAHCNPGPQPKETALQDGQKAPPVQFKIVHKKLQPPLPPVGIKQPREALPQVPRLKDHPGPAH